MRHVISVLLENESGALSRVAGLFSARGYNIESLTVAPTNDPTLSRLTVVTRLIDLTESQFVEREIMLIKVRAIDQSREELKRLSDIYRSRVIDVTDTSYVIEITGDGAKLDSFLNSVGEENIIEVVRSGATGIARGEKSLKIS